MVKYNIKEEELVIKNDYPIRDKDRLYHRAVDVLINAVLNKFKQEFKESGYKKTSVNIYIKDGFVIGEW